MSKFTPGPWDYSEHADFRDGHIMAKTKLVANTSSCAGQTIIEARANGELMAKAPEMYDMIEELRKVLITVYDEDDTVFAPMIDNYLKAIKELQEEINE